MLGFTEITEHKHIMSLSVLYYSNQCTLKRSKHWLKIFRTPKFQSVPVSKSPLPIFFLFTRNNKGTSDWWTEACGQEITPKHIISLGIFSYFWNISYHSLIKVIPHYCIMHPYCTRLLHYCCMQMSAYTTKEISLKLSLIE